MQLATFNHRFLLSGTSGHRSRSSGRDQREDFAVAEDDYIGGYQVIKKWLSYREKPILGRGLKTEEAREITGTARRIAAIILLQPQLDANYQNIKTTTYDWPRD